MPLYFPDTPEGGVTRTLWTVGGDNDLADWTPDGSFRKTYGTGVDGLGIAALTCTLVQDAGATTTWVQAGGTTPSWTSPSIPCAVGDVFRLVYNIYWADSANSLSNPSYSSPSLMGDTLLDESGYTVRASHHFVMNPNEYAIDSPNTDAGYDSWNHGWIYAGYAHVNSAEMIVTDPDATQLVISVGAGPIWGNLAGKVALTAIHLERIAA